MSESPDPFAELLQQDKRYRLEAYAFVFESLHYAHETMGLGKETEPVEAEDEEEPDPNRHVTGQELCEAIRRHALERFGYMAPTVFKYWGIQRTGDFGEIVYNLIKVGKMRKTPADRREDFDDVFDFDADLKQRFEITLPES